jgi:hypothetical protein
MLIRIGIEIGLTKTKNQNLFVQKTKLGAS